ncbi:putative cytochrome P450 hydroxylase [Streptomyces sp. L-9-10]|uniref:cytochrome P450 n=1 Tax=Streptomyces sp. L-9-10 TaxID=1478131 RepID=UPI00101D48E6|nr:cytochrome P450 [Streptomyces sp. L-9-10]RYJ21870.1 putative cytochrome P450 hydroxylase [Streptomyces sp. L-9-10]
MSSTDTTPHTPDEAISDFPGTRSARCPFDPPAEQADWLKSPGLQRAKLRGEPVWVVSRFADIRQALNDPRISADSARPGFPQAQESSSQGAPQSFPRMDDPEHARLRRMLSGDFTVKKVDQLRPRIEEMVDGILEEMIGQGQPADLIQGYAYPVPSMMISMLLGVPYAEHEFFQHHSSTLVSHLSSDEERKAASGALFGYLLELVSSKEQEPTDDIISRLVHERVAAGEISRETVATTALTLLFAGHETTSTMIGLSTLALLQNPDQLARIRATDDPALIANAVEELLRYLTIVQDLVLRVATEDVTIGGQLIRAGEGMLMNLPAGNRDGTFFDRPDAFDIDRNTRGHLAFGYGIHQCIGQSLARAELQIALSALLRRLPGLRLAVPMEQVEFRTDGSTYGLNALPVAW